MYARAKEAQADFMAEEMLKIADEYRRTEIEYHSDQCSSTTVQDNVQRSKLQVDTRKWLLAKLHPKKYGDKVEVNATNHNVNHNVDLSKEDLAEMKKQLYDEY